MASAVALKNYDKVTVYINGQLLVEEASVSLKASSGLNKVYTVQKGFAGVSKGAEEMSISISSAVPSENFEYLPANMPQGQIINVALFCGGKTLSTSGIVMDYDLGHSFGQHATLSMSIAAQYQDFQ